MPEWTGEIIKLLHVHGITAKELAAAAGYSEKYFSAIMNGRRTPRGVEDKVFAALHILIEEKGA